MEKVDKRIDGSCFACDCQTCDGVQHCPKHCGDAWKPKASSAHYFRDKLRTPEQRRQIKEVIPPPAYQRGYMRKPG